jgi:hypothetical protein
MPSTAVSSAPPPRPRKNKGLPQGAPRRTSEKRTSKKRIAKRLDVSVSDVDEAVR